MTASPLCGPVVTGPQPPALLDLEIYEGDSFEIPLQFYSDNPPTTPIPLAGYTFVASFAADGMADLTIANGGILVVDAAQGLIHLLIADTAALPFKTTGWQLDAHAGGPGLPSRWLQGTARVAQAV